MTDFLKTAAKLGQGITFDCQKQFAIRECCSIGASDKLFKFHAPTHDFSAHALCQLNFGFMRDQARRGIGGRRRIHDISADRGLGTNLIVGEPNGATRHGWQRAGESAVVQKTLDRRGSPEPHALVAD